MSSETHFPTTSKPNSISRHLEDKSQAGSDLSISEESTSQGTINPVRVTCITDKLTVRESTKQPGKFVISTVYTFHEWDSHRTTCSSRAQTWKTFSVCHRVLSQIFKNGISFTPRAQEYLKVIEFQNADEQPFKIAEVLQSLYRHVLNLFVNPDDESLLTMKKDILTHLEVPFDPNATSYHVVKTFDPNPQIFEGVDPGEMKENVVINFTGFEDQFDSNQLGISYDLTKVGENGMILVHYWNDVVEINLSDFNYAVVPQTLTQKNKKLEKSKKRKFNLLVASTCGSGGGKNRIQELFDSKKYQLTPKIPKQNCVIIIVVKSKTADKQVQAFFDSFAMKKIPYTPPNISNDEHTGTEGNMTEKKTFEKVPTLIIDGKEFIVLNYMAIEELKLVFQPYVDQLDSAEKDYVEKIYKQCSTISNDVVHSDEILFQGKFMSKSKRFLRIFKGNQNVRNEVAEIVNSKLREMNKSRRFHEKSFYFWTWEDIFDWSKQARGFSKSDVCLKEPIVMFDCITRILSRAKERHAIEKKELPYESFKAEFDAEFYDEDCNDNLSLFEEDMEMFMDQSLRKKDLLKYLLMDKYTALCKAVSRALIDMLEISKITEAQELNKRLERFIHDLGNDNGPYVLNKTTGEIFSENLTPLHDKIPTCTSPQIVMAVQKISNHIKDDLMKEIKQFCDLDGLARLFFSGWKSKNDILRLRMKLNCSSIDRAIGFRKKLGYKVCVLVFQFKTSKIIKFVKFLPREKVPFAFFQLSVVSFRFWFLTRSLFNISLGVSLQSVKLDWFDDSFVRCRKIRSEKIKASFDIAEFFVPVKKIPLIMQFIFSWNSGKKYHNLSMNCQNFALKFTQMMYENFVSLNPKKDIIGELFCGEAKKWINENKFEATIQRKIRIEKSFVKAFPEIMNVQDVKRDNSYFYIDKHDDVYAIMNVFENQKKYNLLKEMFPEKLFLLKAFCRSFYFEKRVGNETGTFKFCYFTTSKKDPRRNEFEIDIYC